MNRSPLRSRLVAESPLCAAIFAEWPDALMQPLDPDDEAATAALASAREKAPRVNDLPLTICWFPTGKPAGPAYGVPRATTWGRFSRALTGRREGEKDGACFVPARFRLEPDGNHIRRLGKNLIARTAITLDIETSKETGEIPPSPAAAAEALRRTEWAAAIYTSHNHTAALPRYRIVLPLAGEIDPELPAVEAVAEKLALSGVFDPSKTGAASLFYLPSATPGELDRHLTRIVDGAPIDAAWIRDAAGELVAARVAEQDRIAAEARAQAEARRQTKIAAGFDADDSLIEKIRAHLDLESTLLAHGYDKRGSKYRHPNSTSGSYGADIKTFAGIDRVFSHNGTDPLHRDNLPDWCGGVTAPDAFDAAVILNFGGDRDKAMHELARRFRLTKADERKTLAKLIFRLIREQAPQAEIETATRAEGARLGLTPSEATETARWVSSQMIAGEAP